MMKRSVSIALAMILTIGLCSGMLSSGTAYAATGNENRQLVIDYLGLMETDEPIAENNTDVVTRAQFAQILYTLYMDGDSDVEDIGYSSYPDVKSSYWASGYIYYVTKADLMNGYLSGYFKPDEPITLLEAAKACLTLLGYTDSSVTSTSTGVISMYKKTGLNDNLSLAAKDDLTESDCMTLLYNLLKSEKTNGSLYGETFDCTLDDNDEIDYEALVTSSEDSYELDGPVMVTSDWEEEIPFAIDSAIVYLNGELSTSDSINEYDVVYYCEDVNTIFAYNAKAVGVVESISPNALNPSTITIGGKSYTLGSEDAIDEVSVGGSVEVGDAVTIILDADNSVLTLLTEDEYNIEYFGVISGVSSTTDGVYLSVQDLDGNTNEIAYDGLASDYEEGDYVVISYTDNEVNLRLMEYVSSFANKFTMELSRKV